MTQYIDSSGSVYVVDRCEDCKLPYYKWVNVVLLPWDLNRKKSRIQKFIDKGFYVSFKPMTHGCECEREDKQE